jgi:hypothetical protein
MLIAPHSTLWTPVRHAADHQTLFWEVRHICCNNGVHPLNFASQVRDAICHYCFNCLTFCSRSHATPDTSQSEVKAKLRPLMESLDGFYCSTGESVKSRNRRLVHELKDKFGLCYQVSTQCTGFCRTLTIDSKDIGDKKRNVSCSGLYKTRLNQKGANLLWYQNKRDEGVMFEKYFTPFPIPALALLYTVVSHACFILLFGSCVTSSTASMNGLTESGVTSISQVASIKQYMINTSPILGSSIHERKPMGSLIPSSRTLTSMGAEVTFNIFISLCLTYYYRTHARVDMMDVTCRDYLSDVEISNAIQESMQECDGGNQSDSVDEVDSESDDNGEDK